jgi:hypothetical protein
MKLMARSGQANICLMNFLFRNFGRKLAALCCLFSMFQSMLIILIYLLNNANYEEKKAVNIYCMELA